MSYEIDLLDLENNINNNPLENKQKEFLNSNLGKVINSGIDIGLKAILPDFLENQVIDIKNVLFENGLKEGLKETINQGIELGKSTTGIFTGEFENISQIENVVKKGGILDSISKLLDTAITFAQSKNLIDKDVSKLIKKGKNSIISAVSEKIEESLTDQIKSVEKLDKYCNKWKEAYKDKNLEEMKKAINNIEKYKEKIVPLKTVLENMEKIENTHKYIINNGNKFELSEVENELLNKLT